MPKALTIMGMVVSIVTLLVFVLDMAIKAPFRGANLVIDIGFTVCAMILLYMSWSTFREQA